MEVYPLLPLVSFQKIISIIAVGLVFYTLVRIIYNAYFHPLSRFPGPRGAACTRWWLAYMEVGRGISLSTLRTELHQKYGDIIRIAPNELHFARPTVYHEIYNSQRKWDKDHEYYRAFDVDESFFTQTDYLKSKHNRSLISNMFSRGTITQIQPLIRDKLDRFCNVLREQNAAGKSSDLYLGFQCFSADTIASFLFGTCFDQLSYPDFQGDIVKGMDISITAVTLAKFSAVIVWAIRNTPPSIFTLLAPSMKGIAVLKRTLEAQVKSVLRNPGLLDDAPHRVMYRELLDPEANKGHPPLKALQLFHEAIVMFSGGSHPIGVILMTGFYHMLHSPEVKQRLVDEVRTAWPLLDQDPSYESLEKLPYLTAFIKETLRIGVAIPAGLPRIVPSSGAVISGVEIPGGTVVSQSALFVSFSEEIFARPREFLPDRWLQPGSKALESWFVAFSKGPRSCLGINLAYCELYLTFAYLLRRFDVREDLSKPADMKWSEHFMSQYNGQHLHAYCDPRSE